MNSEWQQFLAARGARLTEGTVAHFGQVERELQASAQGDVIADLSHLGLIEAKGAEAQAFLHSQLTNDLRGLSGISQLNAYCNAQGRVLAIFRVFRRGDALMLQLPAPLLEPMLKRLRLFVLRAKVTLTDASTSLARIGVSGPTADAALTRLLGSVPGEPQGCETRDDVSVLRLPGVHPRFELVAPPPRLMALWTQLTDVVAVGASRWTWLDIMAGLPNVEPATSEAHIPQALNLDLVDGVNFKKGCYPGQEIVARTHYLGRVKQRLFRAWCAATATPPTTGQALYSPTFGEQAAGAVLSAAASPAGGFDLLAVMQTAAAQAGDLRLGHSAGVGLDLRALPYPLQASI